MKTIKLLTSSKLISRFTLLLSLFIVFTVQGVAQTVVTITSSGSWTVPAGVTTVKVECWGAGGAGGGVNGGATRSGGGGGGGAYTLANAVNVTPGQVITVTVGAGGLGKFSSDTSGDGAGDGNPGGTSTFGSTTPVSASGGFGGLEGRNFQTNGPGGAGGTGTYNGGAGAIGSASTYSGGGGGGAGSGSAGSAASGRTGGAGGTGTIPGGIGANGLLNTEGNGTTSTDLSAGGGGARSAVNTDRKGGDGFRGQVIITYTPCATPSITTQPDNQNVNSGGSATFSVVATGTGLTYQWRKGTTNINDATNASYTISPVAPGDAATNYNVLITGACGTLTSNNATLTINPQPSASVTDHANLTCFGVPGGSITIQASGGSGTGYTFSIDNGVTYTGSGNPYTFTGLSANITYKIRVKDSIGSESPAIP